MHSLIASITVQNQLYKLPPPPRFRGRCNIFSPVQECVSVLRVRLSSAGWISGLTDLNFGTGIKHHHISDGFKGHGHQGQKSKHSKFQWSIRNSVPRSRSGKGHKGQDKKCKNCDFQNIRKSSSVQVQGRKGQGQMSKFKVTWSKSQGWGFKVIGSKLRLFPPVIDSREVWYAS